MFLYDAEVLCLCLYGEDDTLIGFQTVHEVVTSADQTLAATNLTRSMIEHLRDK